MSDRIRKIIYAGIVVSVVLAVRMASVQSLAVEKDEAAVTALEKKMTASGTKKIQYRRGRIHSTASSVWRRAAKISKEAASLTISKKGYYTICVTTNSGKRKVTTLYFKKKKYEFSINQSVEKTAGYYYIIPTADKTKTAEVKNAALKAGSSVLVDSRGDRASTVWQLESAGAGKYRLKNCNSGKYLACQSKSQTAVQMAYAAKDKMQLFRVKNAGSGNTYIQCVGSKLYLQMEGSSLKFSSRQGKKVWKFRWEETTVPASYAVISGATYPVALDLGASFSLTGNVTSRYTLTAVAAGVYDRQGTAVLLKKIYPNSCKASIKKLDAAITFGKLPTGTYTYKVVVRDVTGTDISLINRSFTVGAVISAGGLSLTYDSALIAKIGHQSTGSSLEKKACASYALAYCNAILSGTTPSPHSYWSSSTNVDCVWSKGGYKTVSYSSEQAVLQAAYSQLLAGKPSILHVTGNTAQHWVVVTGYKNSSGSSGISASSFTVLDPWDGSSITLTDKYKVKSTYRLGVKS